MGIKNVIRKIGNSAGNKVAKLAALSSDQVEEIQLQREKYLLEKPDPTDKLAILSLLPPTFPRRNPRNLSARRSKSFLTVLFLPKRKRNIPSCFLPHLFRT